MGLIGEDLHAENDALQQRITELEAALSQAQQQGEQRDTKIQARLTWMERILNTMSGIVYVYNTVEQRNVYVNQNIGALLGYTQEELHEMDSSILPTIMHPDDFARLPELIGPVATATDSEVVTNEYRLRRATGEWIWFEDHATVFSRDAQGNPVELVGMLQDITKRKQQERDLKLFKALVENAPDAIAVGDTQTNLFYANPAYKAITGYGDAIIGMKALQVIVEEDHAMIAEALYKLETQGSANVLTTYRRKDGRTFPVEITSFQIEDDEGESQIIAFVRDITERKQQERQLRLAQFSLQQSMDSIFWLKCDGTFEYANDATCAMLGYTREELLTMNIFDIDPFFKKEQVLPTWNKLVQHGSIRFEAVHRHKDGHDIPMEVVSNYLAFEGQEYVCTFTRDITERKKHEDALRETQQFLQLIIDNIPQAIFWKARDLTFLGCNRYFAETAGLASSNDIVGKNDYEMPWVEIADLYRSDDSEVMENDTPKIAVEEPHVDATHQHKWRRTSKIPLHTPSGEVFAVLGLFEDITERKQMEHTLRLSEARYRAVVTHFPNTAFGIFDRQWRIILADGMNLELVGYTKTQIEGRLLSEVVSPEMFERLKPLVSAAFAGEVATFENEIAARVYRLLYVPIYDEQNRVISVLNITQDITRYRQAEQLLRESEERYRIIAELISDYAAACTVEQDGTITIDWITMGFLRAVDQKFEGIGNDWRDLVYSDDHPIMADVFQQVLTGQSVSFELRVVARDGTLRWLDNYIRPIWDPEESRVVRIFSAAQDITERKAVEAERTALIQDLEARNAELERFTYTVSHDLKSPLITIKGYLGYLESDAQSGNMERMKSDLARIDAAADRMNQLLDELLELSRIGRLMNPSEWVNLTELSHDALLLITGHLHNTHIQVYIAENLPNVYGDRTRLREVIQNLLDNAVKFMGDQPDPKIEVGVRPNTTPPIIYVRDNGIGIEPHYCEKIFGLFEKIDAQSIGTGIGLALVKRIIEVHSGHIWAESEGNGTGATFCFTIPSPEDQVVQGQEHAGERISHFIDRR